MSQKCVKKLLNLFEICLNFEIHLNLFFLTAFKLSDKLMTADVKTVPLSECNEIYKSVNHPAFENGIGGGQYCAHGDLLPDNSRSDSCRGDSGGPLQIVDHNNVTNIVGIVSFGIGCGNENPGIYTRVAHYIEWIASHVWADVDFETLWFLFRKIFVKKHFR